MAHLFDKLLQGYRVFRKKYVIGDNAVMRYLADSGQKPQTMIVACCDSRVDPALILQCNPGDLFVMRNVANIVPPYQKDEALHGTSAALEFGIRVLNIKHLILLGHSQCGGIDALLNREHLSKNDFISKWVSSIKLPDNQIRNPEEIAKLSLTRSYENCMTFPWIKEKVDAQTLTIYRWFFDIKTGQMFTYSRRDHIYQALDV
ncbi:carbonic anhydrase [Rickettsiella grylli]|uniref:Carbonate dehydratase n=1 Tax=Rickettsiella grylli TaxID=59196 RepID=A8PKV4_9COXI|nr:carbonic anhydrase [Rickettsiella grylli]EDP46201.1 carbonate dehydratase [Rickettsiella grylli]OJA00367.1 carbonate dehydratase [Rickettsiella grylli]